MPLLEFYSEVWDKATPRRLEIAPQMLSHCTRKLLTSTESILNILPPKSKNEPWLSAPIWTIFDKLELNWTQTLPIVQTLNTKSFDELKRPFAAGIQNLIMVAIETKDVVLKKYAKMAIA